jgi:hypothetical protein
MQPKLLPVLNYSICHPRQCLQDKRFSLSWNSFLLLIFFPATVIRQRRLPQKWWVLSLTKTSKLKKTIAYESLV